MATSVGGVLNFRAGGREGRPKGRNEWRTPLDLYRALDREFCFQLDAACTTENCLAPCGLWVDRGHDALAETWQGGPVWCNPPYSGQGGVRPWLECGRDSGEICVFLVSADTSTRWWYDVVAAHAAEVRFVVGRLRFRTPEGDPYYTKSGGGGLTTPSAIVVFDPERRDLFSPRHAYIHRDGSPAP